MHSNSVVSGSKLISTAFDRMTHLDRLTDGELGDLVRVAFKLGLRTGLLQREPTDLRTVLAALHVAPVRDGSDLNAQTLRQQLYAVFRSGFAVGATQWRIQEAQDGFRSSKAGFCGFSTHRRSASKPAHAHAQPSSPATASKAAE